MSASNVGGSNYVVPPNLLGGDIPAETYRGDSRSPDIIFNDGFQPRENGTISRDTLQTYAQGHGGGPYVSTSRSYNVAEDFANDNGGDAYVYDVDPPEDRSIDVNRALGRDSPFPREEEVAIAGGVDGTAIKGATNVRTGDYIDNPRYQNPNAGRYDSIEGGRMASSSGSGSGAGSRNVANEDLGDADEFVNPFAPPSPPTPGPDDPPSDDEWTNPFAENPKPNPPGVEGPKDELRR